MVVQPCELHPLFCRSKDVTGYKVETGFDEQLLVLLKAHRFSEHAGRV